MKKTSVKLWLTFAAALVLGVLLHFLYQWYPNSLVSLFAPVNESLWEHVKIIYFPLLISGWFLGGKRGRAPWLFSLLVACGLTLLLGWLYHIVFGGESFLFDLILYVAMMMLGFLLPRILWPLTEWPGVGKLCVLLTAALAVLIVWFTLAPPEGALFADPAAARTFLTIPV